MGEAKAKTTNNRGRGPGKKHDPLFISKSEIAQLLGVADTKTIDSWVALRRFPPPHSQPGPRHSLWLRKHWQVYVDTGEWPPASFPKYQN
jgi:predicted DNA-binding transcriptional regulator AlpA